MRLKPHHPHAHALYLVIRIRSAPERGCLIENSTVNAKKPGNEPGLKEETTMNLQAI